MSTLSSGAPKTTTLDIACDNPLLHALSRMPELASLGYQAFFFANKGILSYALRDDRVVVLTCSAERRITRAS